MKLWKKKTVNVGPKISTIPCPACRALCSESGLQDHYDRQHAERAVREPVLWFSQVMETKLKENDDKGGWQEHQFPHGELMDRLEEEFREVQQLFEERDWHEETLSGLTLAELVRLVREYADVANFSMMGADQAREELKRRTGIDMTVLLSQAGQELMQ